jgi:hypothetical protein
VLIRVVTENAIGSQYPQQVLPLAIVAPAARSCKSSAQAPPAATSVGSFLFHRKEAARLGVNNY